MVTQANLMCSNHKDDLSERSAGNPADRISIPNPHPNGMGDDRWKTHNNPIYDTEDHNEAGPEPGEQPPAPLAGQSTNAEKVGSGSGFKQTVEKPPLQTDSTTASPCKDHLKAHAGSESGECRKNCEDSQPLPSESTLEAAKLEIMKPKTAGVNSCNNGAQTDAEIDEVAEELVPEKRPAAKNRHANGSQSHAEQQTTVNLQTSANRQTENENTAPKSFPAPAVKTPVEVAVTRSFISQKNLASQSLYQLSQLEQRRPNPEFVDDEIWMSQITAKRLWHLECAGSSACTQHSSSDGLAHRQATNNQNGSQDKPLLQPSKDESGGNLLQSVNGI